jgi:hypothetical protein
VAEAAELAVAVVATGTTKPSEDELAIRMR